MNREIKITQLIVCLLISSFVVAQRQEIVAPKGVVDKEILNDHKLYQNIKLSSFVLPNTDGKDIKLNEIKSSTIVLHFWYTHCAPCIVDMPNYKKITDYYNNDTAITFISICVDKGINKTLWREMIKKNKLMDTHVFLDIDKSISKQNKFFSKIDEYPKYLVINRSLKSLGCLEGVDDLLICTYEIERAKAGVPTAQAYIEMMNSDTKFNAWINGKGRQFLGL